MDLEKPQSSRCSKTNEDKVTEDERRFRNSQFPDERRIRWKRIMCTVCGKNLRKHMKNKDASIHPLLNVLWCKECEKFYSKEGVWVDEDGNDKYCRWCGQGGNLYYCDNCPMAFCDQCIVRNFSVKVLKNIQIDEEWRCFICNTKPLWSLRALCDATRRYVDSDLKSKKTIQNCCTFRSDHNQPQPAEPADEEDVGKKAIQKSAALRKILMDKEIFWKNNKTSKEEVLRFFSDVAKSCTEKFENLETEKLQEDMSLTMADSLIVNICSFSSGHSSMNTTEEDQLKFL